MKAYKDLSEAELVFLLREGDHGAFKEVLSRYNAIIINYAYRRVQDRDLAKDLAQDVFTSLWEKRLKYAFNENIEAHVFTAIRSRLIDYYRRQNVSQKYMDSFTAFYSEEENTTDYLVRHHNLSAIIEQEIAALPPKMREVFELSRNKEMQRKEIAMLLDMPENTVKTNLQRALRILKRKFGSSFSILFIFF